MTIGKETVLALPAHETFPALDPLPVRHAFLHRIPGLDVNAERAAAMERLARVHSEARAALGFPEAFASAEQVHGNGVALVSGPGCAPGADALVTDRLDLCLGIYVADCAPVFIVDPVRRAIGLVHSGKKGTELAIARETIVAMQRFFGSTPGDLVVQIGPCIRPPHYEVDFASEIARQCQQSGVVAVHDCRANTAAHPLRYYSYRIERGRTGRLLALLALR
jgi:copper oxidase (laccase) domain-containing protein